MSFFSQFPKINFDVLGDGIENKIIDIFRNVDVRDFKIDDLVTYTYYEIKDGERPDQVSQKLYGDPQYYWTFFTVNDSLKGGLKDWPMSYNQLDNFIKNKYNSYSVITLKPEQYFDNGEFLGYLDDGDSFNSIAGLDIYSDPNIRILLDNGKVLKPFLYDHDNYQLWVENDGDEFISSADSFKIVYDTGVSQEFSQLGRDIDGEAIGDESGYSVSLSGDGTRVAIGAPFNRDNGDNPDAAGHTRIFEWNGTQWNQLGSDIDGNFEFDLSGLNVSLSSDGSRVAIAAPENDGGRGRTKIYEWNGASWIQLGSNIDGEASDDYSGRGISLSADGTRVAIGIPSYFDENSRTRIFQWNGTDWIQLGSDINGEEGDESGNSVSLSADGTRVAIGAPFYEFGSGDTRIYEWDGRRWNQLGSNITFGEKSGSSVSLSADGTRVIIGAPGTNNLTGSARIYEWNGASWIQLGSNIDGENVGDESGKSVSLSADGTRVAIGAPFYDDGNSPDNSGYTRIYDWNGATWRQSDEDIIGESAGDTSGWNVSLSDDGRRVAIGANFNRDKRGHTRIFNLSVVTPELRRKARWIKNVFEPWLQTYNPIIITGETTASSTFDGSLNRFLIEKFVPIASEAPKKYIDPDTGEENCAYGVIINEGQGDIDSFISYRQDEESKNFEKSKIRVVRAQQIGRFVETFKQLLNN